MRTQRRLAYVNTHPTHASKRSVSEAISPLRRMRRRNAGRISDRGLLLPLRAFLAVSVAIAISSIESDVALATCGDDVLVLGHRGMSADASSRGNAGEMLVKFASSLRGEERPNNHRSRRPCDGPHCRQQAPQVPVPVPPTVRILVHDQLAHLLRSGESAELPLLRMVESFDLRPSDGYRSLIERPPRV